MLGIQWPLPIRKHTFISSEKFSLTFKKNLFLLYFFVFFSFWNFCYSVIRPPGLILILCFLSDFLSSFKILYDFLGNLPQLYVSMIFNFIFYLSSYLNLNYILISKNSSLFLFLFHGQSVLDT